MRMMVILMTTTMTKTTMLMMMMVVVVVVISAIMTSVGVGHAMKARSCNHDLSFTVFLLSCLLIRPRRCLVLSLFTTPTSSTLPRIWPCCSPQPMRCRSSISNWTTSWQPCSELHRWDLTTGALGSIRASTVIGFGCFHS
ncbi:unnamed protein product [Symbiodinium microadriaticum]|nr:unnamed protein product [Symbiodinium microadriaticum]